MGNLVIKVRIGEKVWLDNTSVTLLKDTNQTMVFVINGTARVVRDNAKEKRKNANS